MASWSAVYCVRAGEVPADRPGSGVLRLFDPRPGANAYRDPANEHLHDTFGMRSIELRLVEGQIVVFPSYLFHDVAPYYGVGTRITVATKCWSACGSGLSVQDPASAARDPAALSHDLANSTRDQRPRPR